MDINEELVLQEPIEFQGITIYQPTIREIRKFGTEDYNKLLVPYIISLDVLDIPEEEKENIKTFDLIIDSTQLLVDLLMSLITICKTNDVKALDNHIEINGSRLDRDNFDEFSDIILKIHAKEKPKVDKLPENPRQREIELKLRANRARARTKNEFQLCDVINNVKYGGNYYISTEEIKNMTLWELMNAYSAKLGVSQYQDTFSIALVAGDKDNNLRDKHWTKQLKISEN